MGVLQRDRRWSRRHLAVLVSAAGAALALAACHPAPRISVADAHGTEVAREVVFAVTLNANGSTNPRTAHEDVSLFCTTSGGTATPVVDYVPYAGQQCGVIPEGAWTTDVSVQVVADGITEPMIETFTLTVRPDGGGVGVVDGSGLGQIADR